jgi:serine/threonine protein kinase
MAEERWEKAKVIFDGALRLEPEKRRQYLIEACGGDKILLSEVSSLLASLSQADDFMESPAIEKVADLIVGTGETNGEQIEKPANDWCLPSGNNSLIGTTVKERYLVEKRLDEGGFGTVYLARDLQIVSRPVVIKILHKDRSTNEWAINKFRHEVEALARINHPGIVDILDTGELAEGIPFIVMQYVEGVTLRELIKSEGMDYERAAHIVRDISHALEEVHAKKIFHRDLKPENIMIRALAGGKEQVTLIDFGIAKVKESVLAPSTVTRATAGTVSYMSPEQLNGDHVTASSDIYALGTIFYEMLTGRHPFNFESLGQLFYMQQTGVKVMPVDLRPSLSPRAQAIILKALSFEPKDRYQNVRQFGDDLANALINNEPSGVSPPRMATTKPLPDNEIKVLPTAHSPAIEGEEFNIERDKGDHSNSFGRKRWILVSLGLLVLCAASVSSVWFILKYYPTTKNSAANTDLSKVNSSSEQTTAGRLERQISFSLTVQKMNKSQPLGQPFESIGEEVFASGWKFRFNLTASDAGFLYVVDEGQNQKGENAYFVLFPTPKNNNGSARIETRQRSQTLWNVFDNNPGKEKIWFIWSAQKNQELEKIAADSASNSFSVVSQTQIDFLRGLCRADNAAKTTIEKDSPNSTAVIKGSGDLLVNWVELAHKPY